LKPVFNARISFLYKAFGSAPNDAADKSIVAIARAKFDLLKEIIYRRLRIKVSP
jgi:hypothetical protein